VNAAHPDHHSDRSPEATLRQAARAARRLSLTGVVVLVLFAVLAGVLTWRLRDALLAGLVARDAEVIASVVRLRIEPIEDELVLDNDLPRDVQLMEQLLEVSALRGVLGLRLYDEAGNLTRALPETFLGHPCSAATLAISTPDQPDTPPVAEFIAAADPAAWLAPATTSPTGPEVPLVLIRLPLRLPVTGENLGHAEFLIDGTSLAAQRAALDRDLLVHAGLLLGVAALIGAALHRWAWVGLRRHAKALAGEQQRLLRSNVELALAVKASAIGSVTAHLMHDLKGSLAGLEAFVRAGLDTPSALVPDDWRAAAKASRDLRHLSAEITDILSSLETGEGVDLDTAELLDALRTRHEPLAQTRGVALHCMAGEAASVDGRQSQLVLLVLSNLLRNAIEATPSGGRVALRVDADAAGTRWRVIDNGPGVPDEIRAHLFRPGRSTKPDGGGIGLAISAQIAAHLSARLELLSTGPDGSVFQLLVPSPANTSS
jgi:signal transduction histidine kinase